MPNQDLLIRSLVELADEMVDDFDLVDLLTLLADRCVAALDVTAAGVMIAAPSGALELIASSSETMRLLEVFQLQADQGPCIDTYRSGQPTVNVDLTVAGSSWPALAARAVADGFRSAHSLPMRLRGHTLGALNLLHADQGPFGDTDIFAAQALADIASIAIVQHKVVVDAQTLTNQLNEALNSRVVIEQAKGRIVQASRAGSGRDSGTEMDQAFRRLRNHARNHNLRLSDLADQIAQGTIEPQSLDRPP